MELLSLMMSNVDVVIDLLDDDEMRCSPMEIDDDNQNVNKFNLRSWGLVCEENKLFTEIIEKCLDIEDSKAMQRVLKQMVIPVYKELDENYSKSTSFEKVLSKTIHLLEKYPLYKYSHLQNLYETLKLHKVRKKVNFVTLATKISDKRDSVNKQETDHINNICKKPKLDSINLVDENPPTINLDSYECDVVVVEEGESHLDEEKENKDLEKTYLDPTKNPKNILPKFSKVNNLVTSINNNEEIQTNLHLEEINHENNYLIPKSVKFFHEESNQTDTEKMLNIENEIAMYNKKIAILEEQEVDDDTMTSPYIISEKYKAKIVTLYKELCHLMGADSVKRHEVRLQVNEGHPPGPVRRLERFLNQNIKSDGHPPFPDFRDVVKCVIISNEEDELGWNRGQIMKEATSLFTQCGRALQQRRQKREWRHLMCRVKQEQCDDDPAADNPELEARLQKNKRIAAKKEAEILERFSMMQYSMPSKESEKEILADDISDSDNGSSEEERESTELNCSDKAENLGTIIHHKICTPESIVNGVNNHEEVIVKKEPVVDPIDLLAGFGDNYTTTIKEIEDPFLVIEISSDSSSNED